MTESDAAIDIEAVARQPVIVNPTVRVYLFFLEPRHPRPFRRQRDTHLSTVRVPSEGERRVAGRERGERLRELLKRLDGIEAIAHKTRTDLRNAEERIGRLEPIAGCTRMRLGLTLLRPLCILCVECFCVPVASE